MSAVMFSDKPCAPSVGCAPVAGVVRGALPRAFGAPRGIFGKRKQGGASC